MSLLLLLKPTGAPVVIPPPPPSAAPAIGQGAQSVLLPPALYRFPGGTATVLFGAIQPGLILLPPGARARVRLKASLGEYEMRVESLAAKHPTTYRAVRDERVDEEFLALIQTVFLLTR